MKRIIGWLLNNPLTHISSQQPMKSVQRKLGQQNVWQWPDIGWVSVGREEETWSAIRALTKQNNNAAPKALMLPRIHERGGKLNPEDDKSKFPHRQWGSLNETHWGSVILLQFSSVQFKMVSMRTEKPICAPPRLSEGSPTLPFKRFQCSSDWRWPSLVLSTKIV